VAQERAAESGWIEIKEAAAEGTAEGLRLHLPATIGLLVKGLCICFLMALVHRLIGVGVLESVLLSGFFGLAGINITAFLRRRNGKESDEGED
jgi:hypothetical protein